ncbi:MAG: SNF2 helicase associated domain-containing protein [Clostridia bacterium]
MNYKEVINDNLKDIELNRRIKGKRYQEQGRVTIEEIELVGDNGLNVSAYVEGTNRYPTYVAIRDFGYLYLSTRCGCPDYADNCKHTAAVLYELLNNNYFDEIEKAKRYKDGITLIDTISNYENTNNKYNVLNKDYRFTTNAIDKVYEDIQDNNAKLETRLYIPANSDDIFVEFYVGVVDKKTMQKIKDISVFFEKFKKNEYDEYGKYKLKHSIEKFDLSSIPTLNFLLKHGEILKIANDALDDMNKYRYNIVNLKSNRLKLNGIVLDEFFDLLKGREVEIKTGKDRNNININNDVKDIVILTEKINDTEYVVKNNISKNSKILNGLNNKYIIEIDKELSKLNKDTNKETLKVVDMMSKFENNEVIIDKDNMPNFISGVVPKILENFDKTSIKDENLEKLLPKKLAVKVMLDVDEKGYIILKPIYCYDDIEIDPFKNNNNDFRNFAQEKDIENYFINTGFIKNSNEYIMTQYEKIYEFLTSGVNEYMEKFEVLVTDDFKAKEIKRPKIISMGVKVENNLLDIDFSKMNIDKEELYDVLKQYKIKKKYHVLKDGSIIDLESSSDLSVISDLTDNMNIDIKNIKNGKFRAPLYRSSYLNNVLDKMDNIDIKKDDKYKEIVDRVEDSKELEYELPSEMKDILRYYQVTGFKWLKVLDDYKFGGILADDMGLR